VRNGLKLSKWRTIMVHVPRSISCQRILQTFTLGLWALSFLIFISPCFAQESEWRIQGYVFAAPGLRTHEEEISGITHVGGGGEVAVYRKLAVAAEIGYLRPWQETYEDVGLFSLDAIFHMPKRGKVSPFVLAGLSLSLRDRTLALHRNTDPYGTAETLNLANFGIGCTFWFKPRSGLRFELRDHLYLAEADRHYLEYRIGFAFH
jgi:hypothetical protein